jgi:arginase
MSLTTKTIYLIGSASGAGAPYSGCEDGPESLQRSPYFNELSKRGLDLRWVDILKPEPASANLTKNEIVVNHCQKLAEAVEAIVAKNQFFTVFGGDHSCAIGTWSGVHSITAKKGDIGLIWIDAHMDSHTPDTSETGNIHGMPLACLLGQGDTSLTEILGAAPKFKPEHVCLIGIRSYEKGEAELLKRLNVRIYFMDEVKRRGLDEIMQEALSLVNAGTIGYGVTLDIDSIDPVEAPGTGVSEENGLSAKELSHALNKVAGDSRLLGLEIVEFDPHRDVDHMTEKLVPQLLAAMIIKQPA